MPYAILSVLDQSPIPEGLTGGDALRNSIDLARLADSLGYFRYWVAEHHATPALACASPEILIGPIAAATKQLRVGSGGIMLPHYSPLKVAENFSMLSALHPGRIDLGLGRAPGSDAVTAFALQRDRRQRAPDDFPEQLAELLGYLENRPTYERFAELGRLPGRPHAPEPHLLGSSPQSGIWAAEFGLPYVFADFINPAGAPIATRYRETFAAGQRLAAPYMIVAVWAVCAETDEEARRLAASSQMMLTLLHRGQLIAVPPPEQALEFFLDEGTPPEGRAGNRRMIIGTPAAVRRDIESVAAAYQADEVMLVNILHSHAARRRSYELIAEQFGLSPAAAGGARPQS